MREKERMERLERKIQENEEIKQAENLRRIRQNENSGSRGKSSVLGFVEIFRNTAVNNRIHQCVCGTML
jgi:hypothetical protein